MTSTYNPNKVLDIREESVQILKTILLLDKSYSAGYLARVLQASEQFPLRNANHKELETYGVLSEHTYGNIADIIDYLIQESLLEVAHPTMGTLKVTAKGEEFLGDPQPLEVNRQNLRKSWYQYELMMKLKELRVQYAAKEELAPYLVFTNFTLRQLITILPETMAEMDEIPGMADQEESLKLQILASISEILEKKSQDDVSGIYSRAHSPSHRKVKEMYESGFDPAEIARRRKLQLGTVRNYLITLHQAGEIDLKPWIEETVDNKALHKAGEYFKQANSPKLKEAHEVLGLDYDTLELCRLYVGQA